MTVRGQAPARGECVSKVAGKITVAAAAHRGEIKMQTGFSKLSYGLVLSAALWAASAGAQVVADGGAASESPAEIPALYTNEQADIGASTFSGKCNGCHGDSMIEIFSGYESAGKYFSYISGSMPADAPGSMENSEYVAIIAYLMREMGFPAGEKPLLASRQVLDEIKLKDAHEALGYGVDAEKK